MAAIDIRDIGPSEVTEIVFSDWGYLNNSDDDAIGICQTGYGERVEILKKNVPNLIKALQKAMELWN